MTEHTNWNTNGWQPVVFGDVVENVNESDRNAVENGLTRYIGLEHIEPENVKIKDWGNLLEDDVSFSKRFSEGQVLFVKRRAYQRKIAVADFDGICSGDVLTLRPSSEKLLPELLPYIMFSDSFFEHAVGTSSGSLSPRTRWSQLQDYEFFLPSLAEQRRITKVLDGASATLNQSLHVLASLEQLRLSLSSRHFKNIRSKQPPYALTGF